MTTTELDAPREGRGFAAMRHRDFRLIAIGNMVSQMGTWGQYVAVGWTAKRLTDSNIIISILFGSQWLPTLLLASFTGVLADRYDRRTIVMWGNVAMVAPPLITGLLIQTHHITLLLLLVLVLLSGVGTAFTSPAASAMIPSLVPANDLHSAVALNQGMSNSTRIVGPALAGIMIATWGPEWGFHVNGISFLAVAGACIFVRARPEVVERSPERRSMSAELRIGVAYCRRNRAVGVMIFLASMVGFFVLHASLLPAIAKDVLHGDASTYGLISTAPGIGTVVAAIIATNLATERTRLRVAAACAALVPLTTLAIGASRSVAMAILALGAFGIVWTTFSTLIGTMVIAVTDDAYRGRVMGLMSMASIGVFPVNAVIAGVMADWVGAANTILLSGVCLVGALAAFFAFGYMRVIADGVRGWQHGTDEPAIRT